MSLGLEFRSGEDGEEHTESYPDSIHPGDNVRPLLLAPGYVALVRVEVSG